MVLHLQIYGRVQGVYYRASTQKYARSLGLVGWVRNRSDGSVELCAYDPSNPQKESFRYKQLKTWCQDGPEYANVTQVDFDWVSKTEDWSDFSILRTS